MDDWPAHCPCRVCTLRKTATSGLRFGLPLVCPKCPMYYGILKVPGERAVPCPNCSTRLVSARRS